MLLWNAKELLVHSCDNLHMSGYSREVTLSLISNIWKLRLARAIDLFSLTYADPFRTATLHEKCPNLKFFWSAFLRIWTRYRDNSVISVWSPNTGKKRPGKSRLEHCSCSTTFRKTFGDLRKIELRLHYYLLLVNLYSNLTTLSIK